MLYLVSDKKKHTVIRREYEAGYRLQDISTDFHLIVQIIDVIKE